jgi:serine protease Do
MTKILSFFLVIMFILLAACGNGASEETPTISTTTIAVTSTPAITSTPTLIPTTTPISTSTDTLPSVADAVATVYPSVVTINTEATTYSFFYGQQVQEGAGSGWIYREDGIIVTNNHVVEGAEKVTVGLADGRAFEAEVLYGDSVSDLAIVKIKADNLPVARVGVSAELRVGDWVVAIGNPLGQGLRAKQGIVSGLNISLSANKGESLYNLIETSAAINPGNSGGPLADMTGEVIGITSAKISAVGVEGMGYAISTETAVPIIEQLIDKGYVSRPWLGAQFVTVDRLVAMINRLSVNTGAVISQVVSGSPADKAGLKVLDVIVNYNGEKVTTAEALENIIISGEIGQTVKITYVDGRTTKTTTATLVESPVP